MKDAGIHNFHALDPKEPDKMTKMQYLIANDCIWFNSITVKWLVAEIDALTQKVQDLEAELKKKVKE